MRSNQKASCFQNHRKVLDANTEIQRNIVIVVNIVGSLF